MNDYDVIVIGAGHAGIEAALAASRMGCRTLVLTLRPDTIGAMSCNPAIGGVGKGQLVREIDALGGEMARAADACGIQFRTLNASKGPAVQSSRVQVDMYRYARYMSSRLLRQRDLTLKIAEAKRLLVSDGRITGVGLASGEKVSAQAVVVAPGTFLEGLIHVGLKHSPGGRINEAAVSSLADELRRLGFELLRFKTGTCPRLNARSIDYRKLIPQYGDSPPRPVSFSTRSLRLRQVPCHITYTNPQTHQIIKDNLHRSPLYAGIIKATGVRYCPSIEDKVVRFAERQRHQVFLEPQGLARNEVYPNGLSTSLPQEVQLLMLRSIEGLQRVEVIRFGYGIEHSVVEPRQLYPSLETKLVKGLFLAGQINGTTGYEEAAAQGLLAGINAGLRARNKEAIILDRACGYIGVLVDDLTTKGTQEPYRMFTSRVEYRLLLREDNADLRLRAIGYRLGLVSKSQYEQTKRKEAAIRKGLQIIRNTHIKPGPKINLCLEKLSTTPLTRRATLEELLKRPQVRLSDLAAMDLVCGRGLVRDAWQQVEIETKYAGFIQRQLVEVERFKGLERIRIPERIDYGSIPGVSREIKEKLSRSRPVTLGQASRISGVTPAAISLLMIYLRKRDAKT